MRTALASDDEGEEPSGSISGYDANGDRWTVTFTGKVHLTGITIGGDVAASDLTERIQAEVEKALGERNQRLLSTIRRPVCKADCKKLAVEGSDYCAVHGGLAPKVVIPRCGKCAENAHDECEHPDFGPGTTRCCCAVSE